MTHRASSSIPPAGTDRTELLAIKRAGGSAEQPTDIATMTGQSSG